jgi:ribonuclease G
MSNKLIITRENNQIISSLLEQDELVQINVESEDNSSGLGNIYLGKVKNIVKNINAAFIEIEQGKMCYFSLSENKNPIFSNVKNNDIVTVGDEIIVQISKEDIKTKAPVATSNINFTGKYVILTRGNVKLALSNKIHATNERERLKNFLIKYKNSEYGFIIRTNATNVPIELLTKEINLLIAHHDNLKEFGIHKNRFSLLYKAPASYLCAIRDGFAEKLDAIITDDAVIYEEVKEYLNSFQNEDLKKLRLYDDKGLSLTNLYSLYSKLQKALQQKVWLKSGGSLIIQPTEALVVIDVNTGKAIQGKKKAQDTFFKTNMEAAIEIAKQIRLRNLSGIIVIDFIDMDEESNKISLMSHLKELFSKDPIKTVLVDMTALGLVEITRKKVRKPLYEQVNS